MANYKDIKYDFSGANLTALNATQLTSGTTPDARYTTLPAVSGVNLTSLNATNLGSGTVPTARLGTGTASSSTILYGDNTWAAGSGTTINNNADNRVISGSGTANTLEGEANLTFDGTDLTVSTGNVVIGTAGKGIDFSAQTPAAGMETEILNHYETGTWTAAIVPGSGTVTTNGAIQTMWYTKIGKMVHIQGGCNASAISSPSGNLKLTGNPYAAGGSGATSQYGYSAISGRFGNFDSMESMQTYVSHNAANIWFEQFSGGSATNPGALVTATSQFIIGGTYMAAA